MKHLKHTLPALITGLLIFTTVSANAQHTWKIPASQKFSHGSTKAYWILEGKKLKKATTTGFEAYYATGELKLELRLQKDGTWLSKSYYKSGQLGKIGITPDKFEMDKRGVWKTYHPNGQLKQTVYFKRFYIRQGPYKEYYPSGVQKVTGQYGDYGAKTGVWTYYDEDGNVKSTGDGDEVESRHGSKTGFEEEYFDIM